MERPGMYNEFNARVGVAEAFADRIDRAVRPLICEYLDAGYDRGAILATIVEEATTMIAQEVLRRAVAKRRARTTG